MAGGMKTSVIVHGGDVLHTWKMLDVMLLNSPSTTGLTYCGLCPARVGTMPAVIRIEHTRPAGQASTGLPACGPFMVRP